jgi:hypothetical protein
MALLLQPILFRNVDLEAHSRPAAYSVLGLPIGTSAAITLHPRTRSHWVAYVSFAGEPFEQLGTFATPEEALEHVQLWERLGPTQS